MKINNKIAAFGFVSLMIFMGIGSVAAADDPLWGVEAGDEFTFSYIDSFSDTKNTSLDYKIEGDFTITIDSINDNGTISISVVPNDELIASANLFNSKDLYVREFWGSNDLRYLGKNPMNETRTYDLDGGAGEIMYILNSSESYENLRQYSRGNTERVYGEEIEIKFNSNNVLSKHYEKETWQNATDEEDHFESLFEIKLAGSIPTYPMEAIAIVSLLSATAIVFSILKKKR